MAEVQTADLCASSQCLNWSAPHSAFCFICLRLPGKQQARDRELLGKLRKERLARDAANKNLGSHSHIYAVDCEGEAVKFGIARRPLSRLAGLQVSHFKELKLLGVLRAPKACEILIHDFLAEERIRGEWFRYSEGTNRVIDLIRSKNVDGLKSLIGFSEP